MGAAPISVAPNVRQKQDVYIVIGKNNKKKIPQNISVYSWGRTLSCYMFGGTWEGRWQPEIGIELIIGSYGETLLRFLL